MAGISFKGEKGRELSKRAKALKERKLLDDFAGALEDDCSIEEAAFRAGANRSDGPALLRKLRDGLGFDLTR